MNIQLLSSKMILYSISFFLLICITTPAQTNVTGVTTYNASGIVDQDDMCVWVHPTDKSLSTIIASDKTAGKLFVYNLDGTSIQTLDVGGSPGPGNIDIRYNFMLSGVPTDIVAYNARNTESVEIYKVDPTDRKLYFISNFSASGMSGRIYGFCLYKSPSTGKYYAIGSSNSTQMRQWELVDNGNGTIGGVLKSSWNNGSGDITEGLVADDELGLLYCGNEGEGIYRYDAEPLATRTGTLVSNIGINDVEGITIYYGSNGQGYLIQSSQGLDRFDVFDRQPPNAHLGYFTVTGVGSTDGIDVCNVNLGGNFTQGIFLCHDGTGSPYLIRGIKFQDLGLTVDTEYWDPRGEHGPLGLNDDDNGNRPKDYLLLQNYPNPFNPSTEISFYLPEIAKLRLSVYNVIGELASILVDGEMTAGLHQIEFDAKGLTSGVYFYRVETDKFIETKKMILLR